ncbi:hypothetical protein Tco_0656805 [Tanacetum coccineum]|uniref:Uncharacterized protein n=1 Tax=Tanacetum coccineum TaxID=301880 RepID=A0ABQ4X9W0_9ASTR
MDDPNITMEEYIRLEKEKARRRGKVHNWETAMYGKIWDNEDVYDLGSVETEFPAIVLNDALTYGVTLSCEPTVSPFNDNKIDFRTSFDESDDEDYTPTVSCLNDLDFLKDFENEFQSPLRPIQVMDYEEQQQLLKFLLQPRPRVLSNYPGPILSQPQPAYQGTFPKDQGKGNMVEEPQKKKMTLQQIRALETTNDEEVARKIQA